MSVVIQSQQNGKKCKPFKANKAGFNSCFFCLTQLLKHSKKRNGLIIQWGVTSVTSSGTQVKQGIVTFPISFSSKDSYYATVSGNFWTADSTASGTMRCGYVGTNHISESVFKYRTQGASSSDTSNATYWFAIGN